jgi:DNA-binding response OmpR family regulator
MAKILLVEDDQDFSLMLSDFLLLKKHEVETAFTGQEALEHLCQDIFDLIILDGTLPDMTGVTVRLKYRELGGFTPILMLTGATVDASADTGTSHYMAKPCSFASISEKVEEILA